MDIFGYAFLNDDGLGIGQHLEYLLSEFDFCLSDGLSIALFRRQFRISKSGGASSYEVIKGTIEKVWISWEINQS